MNIRARLHKLISLQSFVVCTDASTQHTIEYLNARDVVSDKIESDVTALVEAARRSVDWMMQYGDCDECGGSSGRHYPGCWVGPVEAALAAFDDGDNQEGEP